MKTTVLVPVSARGLAILAGMAMIVSFHCVPARDSSSLAVSYGRSSRSGSWWGVSSSYGSPGYSYSFGVSRGSHGRHPGHGGWYSGGWGYPDRSHSHFQYSRHGSGRSNWSVGYRYSSPPRVIHYPYYGYPAYGYSGYTAAPQVTLGYAWGGRHNTGLVGVSIPLTTSFSSSSPRPSMSDRIVHGPAVERHSTMMRVWVPGRYEVRSVQTTRSPYAASSAGSASATERVWIPGHWEYVPDQ